MLWKVLQLAKTHSLFFHVISARDKPWSIKFPKKACQSVTFRIHDNVLVKFMILFWIAAVVNLQLDISSSSQSSKDNI